MAKRRNEPVKKSSTNTPLIAMVVAAVAVIAVVAWALSRSVEPTPAPVPQVAEQAPPAVDTSTFTAPPPPSTTAWSTAPGTAPGTQPTLTPPPITSAPPITATPQASGTAAVSRIAAENLKTQFDRGAVTIIDVRDATSYAQGHIPGALHIPMASIQTEIPNLPKNKPIVTYCTWPAEETSAGAALIMQASGIQNVSALSGGLDAWRRVGYPIQSGQQ